MAKIVKDLLVRPLWPLSFYKRMGEKSKTTKNGNDCRNQLFAQVFVASSCMGPHVAAQPQHPALCCGSPSHGDWSWHPGTTLQSGPWVPSPWCPSSAGLCPRGGCRVLCQPPPAGPWVLLGVSCMCPCSPLLPATPLGSEMKKPSSQVISWVTRNVSPLQRTGAEPFGSEAAKTSGCFLVFVSSACSTGLAPTPASSAESLFHAWGLNVLGQLL